MAALFFTTIVLSDTTSTAFQHDTGGSSFACAPYGSITTDDGLWLLEEWDAGTRGRLPRFFQTATFQRRVHDRMWARGHHRLSGAFLIPTRRPQLSGKSLRLR